MESDNKWHLRFLEVAKLISTWSKDPRTKVGAVIVHPRKNKIIATGYNGFPRFMIDKEEDYLDRLKKTKYTVHAELNAILNAEMSVDGCFIYCTHTPCFDCAKAIVQSGIDRVFASEIFHRPEQNHDFEEIKQYLNDNGIKLKVLDVHR